MASIDAKDIVGNGFPPEEGARLADELLKRNVDFDKLKIDLRSLPASLVISAFFNGFLERVATANRDLLTKARQIDWVMQFDFQTDNVKRWMKDFKLFVSTEQRA